MENNFRWTQELLNDMNKKSDEVAESIIREIAAGENFNLLKQLFTLLNGNNAIADEDGIKHIVYDYFHENNELPPWSDLKKIELGQEVYARFAPQVALILNFYALPICYTCKKGAKVLSATGRLVSTREDLSKTFRRLFETSKIVSDVMTPGGLAKEGCGIVTAKKVRLYHAAVRYFLMYPDTNAPSSAAKWDNEVDGIPINQEEMAGTLMAFSALVLWGLEQLGAKLDENEKDAYMHCWLITGYYMGIDEALYPANYQEGLELGIAIIKRNKQESEEGRILTQSLLLFSKYMFKGTIFQWVLLTSIPPYLMYFFMSHLSKSTEVNLIQLLGIETHFSPIQKLKGKSFLFTIKLITRLESRSIVIRKLFSRMNLTFLNHITRYYLKQYKGDLYIPSSLDESWKMK